MSRPVLPESRVHPAALRSMERRHSDTVEEVKRLVDQHDVVVVGMGINPHPGKAVRYLKGAGVAHHYVGYGSYFSQWQKRLALKMWAGWPTFPMVFVKGTLVGGASDLKRLVDAGELDALLKGPRAS